MAGVNKGIQQKLVNGDIVVCGLIQMRLLSVIHWEIDPYDDGVDLFSIRCL